MQKRSFIIATVAAVVFYIINRLAFLAPGAQEAYVHYHYPLEKLYAIFLALALVVLIAVHRVYQINKDNTGYAYLAATIIQMGVAFFLLKPILAKGAEGRIEKINFFCIFILFLAIETALAIRLLNKTAEKAGLRDNTGKK